MNVVACAASLMCLAECTGDDIWQGPSDMIYGRAVGHTVVERIPEL